MPRLYGSAFEDEHPGTLTLKQESSDRVEVFYTPSQERVQLSGLGENDTEMYRVKLLQIDGHKKSLMVFPIRATGRHDVFLKPKYRQVQQITIRDRRNLPIDFDRSPLRTQEDVMMLLEELPSCFVKDFDWGLGLRQPYRFVVDAVEDLSGCTEILITDQDETRIDDDNGIFVISLSDFTNIRNQYIGRRLPKLLLLDEVDAVLHPSMVVALVTTVKSLFVPQGTKVLMTSHSPMTVAAIDEADIFRVVRTGGAVNIARTTK